MGRGLGERRAGEGRAGKGGRGGRWLVTIGGRCCVGSIRESHVKAIYDEMYLFWAKISTIQRGRRILGKGQCLFWLWLFTWTHLIFTTLVSLQACICNSQQAGVRWVARGWHLGEVVTHSSPRTESPSPSSPSSQSWTFPFDYSSPWTSGFENNKRKSSLTFK